MYRALLALFFVILLFAMMRTITPPPVELPPTMPSTGDHQFKTPAGNTLLY